LQTVVFAAVDGGAHVVSLVLDFRMANCVTPLERK